MNIYFIKILEKNLTAALKLSVCFECLYIVLVLCYSKPTKPFCDKLSNMPKTCNCRKTNKDNCPLKGNCLIKNVIYKVKVWK